jgi:hypothetical protein
VVRGGRLALTSGRGFKKGKCKEERWEVREEWK